MDLKQRPVWTEIYPERYAHNLKEARRRIGEKPLIMAVVKADAYGHGALPLAAKALEAGAERLGVALVEEGVELREAGFEVPIQAMGGFLPSQIDAALENDIILTISERDLGRAVDEAARGLRKKARVHVKVDTGMGRMGPVPEKALELVRELKDLPNLELEGIMSHMSCADSQDKTHTKKQFKTFKEIINALKGQGIEFPIKHIANSATIIDCPEMSLDMVRPGIMSYGLWPSNEMKDVVELQPVMEWKARVAQIKEVPAGSKISYGATYVTAEKSKLALLPLGYADGLNRLLSNRGSVIIGGKRAPIRGRVCMDQTILDVTDIPGVNIGDEAVIIGKQEEESISADEIAELLGTINYEVTCMVNKRVPRFLKE